MDAIERVGATIGLREPDRVPVDLHNFQMAARVSGLPMSQVFRDGGLLAEAMLMAWREFGHDMILLENGTGCNAEACGVEPAAAWNPAACRLKPGAWNLEPEAS